jgi:Family of unknown function (DUF6662)
MKITIVFKKAHAPENWMIRATRARNAALLAFLSLGASQDARADEQFLAFTRGAETLPHDRWEIYQFATLRTGKDSGEYYGFDFDTEVEYGLTDRWQLSGALVMHYFDYHGVEELDDLADYRFGGVELSTKYGLLSPFKDPIGLAFRLEGGYLIYDEVGGLDQKEWYVAPEFDFQKNFLDDTLITELDVGAEWAWGKQPAEQYPREMSLQGAAGVAYRFLPNWFVGAEARIRSEYPLFDIWQFEHAALYTGPSLHYSSQRWWVTLSWLYQAWGDGVDEHGGRTFAEETSQIVRLKLGLNF